MARQENEGVTTNRWRLLFRVMQMLKLFLKLSMVWLHSSVNILKTTELYTLKGLIVWYEDYISTKLLF